MNQIEEAVKKIIENHHKILEDWTKAYLAQLYEGGMEIKPGCFTLVEQQDMILDNGKVGKKYWFEPKDEKETNNEKMAKMLIKQLFDLKDYVNEQIERMKEQYNDQFEGIIILKQIKNMLNFLEDKNEH